MTKQEAERNIEKWREITRPFIDKKVKLNVRREELLQEMKQLQEDYIKGDEYIFEAFPERLNCVWAPTYCEYENRVYDYVELPKGCIKKLIGRELSWEDEPVEL